MAIESQDSYRGVSEDYQAGYGDGQRYAQRKIKDLLAEWRVDKKPLGDPL